VLDLGPGEKRVEVRSQVRVAQPLDLCGRLASPSRVELENASDSTQALARDGALGNGRFPKFSARVDQQPTSFRRSSSTAPSSGGWKRASKTLLASACT